MRMRLLPRSGVPNPGAIRFRMFYVSTDRKTRSLNTNSHTPPDAITGGKIVWFMKTIHKMLLSAACFPLNTNA